MTLEKQIVGIPLLGLNTLADPKSATAGEFDLAENVWFARTARGGAELRKRYGGAALARSVSLLGNITKGSRLATFGDERLIAAAITAGTGATTDPGSLYSYSPTAATWKQVGFAVNLAQGAMPSIGLTSDIVASSANSCDAPDVAVNGAGTYMCVAWKDATTLQGVVSVIDLVTGEQTIASARFGTTLGAAGWVRVVALASSFMVLTGSTVGNAISARSVDFASPFLITGASPVLADLNVSCKADVVRNGTNDSVLLAYHTAVPNTKIAVINSDRSLGATTTNAEIPSQAIGWVNWDFSDGNGYLAFVSAATGAKVFTVSQAGPAITGTTVMDATVTAAANVTGYRTAAAVQFNVFIEVRAASAINVQLLKWPGTGVAAPIYQRGVGLAAGCFKVPATGRFYLLVTYDSALQAGNYLLDVSTAATVVNAPIVGRAVYGVGGSLSAVGSIAAGAAISSSVIATAALKLVQNPTGTKIYSVGILRWDFAATSISGAKRIGGNLHMPGGSTRIYDGLMSTELGFYVFPESPTLAQGGGGALTVLGSYQYAAVYAWPDSKSQWHRSAPSPLAGITLTGANNAVTVTIPTLRLTNKDDISGNTGPSRVAIEVYRTVAGGTTFFRVTGNITQSSQTVDTVAFSDLISDASISANEILYTTGKVLPRLGPPSARLMEAWRNRLFLAGTENPNELWVSNEYSFGLGGVSFSDALVIQMEVDGGPITALAEMDDRLVIFKRNSIYVLTGNGPTLTGENMYSQPIRITSTVGAVEQRGVVRTRDGLMFRSTRGIYLLGHGGQIIYAGAGVDAFNSLTVSGACILEDEEQVRFTTIEGTTLVYHYGFPDAQGIGRWTTFTNQPAVDCIVWNGKFVFLKTDGTVVEETVGAYSDPGGVSITAKVRLAWLNLTQFFGRFKLYGLALLGDIMATFTLTHRIAYDYDPAISETETKAVTVATIPPLQLSPARRRAVAAQVTLEETSTTEGFRASGWGVEVGVEPGARKAGTEKFMT